MDVSALLTTGTPAELTGAVPVCQATLVLALSDVLAEHGVHARFISGLSLGGMIAGALSEAVSRPDFFMLMSVISSAEVSRFRVPGESGPPDSGLMAVCTIPYAEDPNEYCARLGLEHLYLLSDGGPIDATWSKRRITVGGHRSAVDAFIAALPPRTRTSVFEMDLPPHCPMRQRYVEDFIDPLLDEMAFSEPRIPVLSCLEDRTLTTGAQIRQLLRGNHLLPAHVPHITTGLDRELVGAYLMLGPSLMSQFVASPIPSVHVEEPEHIPDALQMLQDMDIAMTQVSQ